MNALSLKKRLSHFLNMRALKAHHSKLGWRDAPKYTACLKACQRAFSGPLPGAVSHRKSAAEFRAVGTVAIWDGHLESVANDMFARITQWQDEGRELWNIPQGELYGSHQNYKGDLWADFPELERAFTASIGDVLMNIYEANYKIFYTSMVKSVGVTPDPKGSQQWHNDAGPGSCVIVAMYLHPTDEHSGCLQTLPWQQSLEIYQKERATDDIIQGKYAADHNISVQDLDKLTIRSLRHAYYDDIIQTQHKDKVLSPRGKAGSVVLFRNNTLHRGGHPSLDRERYALLMHCYPANGPTPFSQYREKGLKKTTGYPADPAF